MTTRKPADEFGARIKLDVGDFNRRDAQLAVDLPLTENLKTKFMGASFKKQIGHQRIARQRCTEREGEFGRQVAFLPKHTFDELFWTSPIVGRLREAVAAAKKTPAP